MPALSRARNCTQLLPEVVTVTLAPFDTGDHESPPFADSRYWYPATPVPTSVEPEALTAVGVVTHDAEPPVTTGAVGLVRSITQATLTVLCFVPW